MPNILFVDYDENNPVTKKVQEIIGKVMENLGITDAIITPIRSNPHYIGWGNNSPAPYIVVRSSSRWQIRKIIRELKRLQFGYDVEKEKIEGFIPGSKMR